MAVRIFPTAPAEYYAERARKILSDWHRAVSAEMDVQMEALARRGLEWDPRNPELHFVIGEGESTQGDLATDPKVQAKFDEQSVTAYRDALACAPGDVRFYLPLGMALDNLRRFSESDALFARALELDPNGGGTHCSVANQSSSRKGKYAKGCGGIPSRQQISRLAAGGSGSQEDRRGAKGQRRRRTSRTRRRPGEVMPAGVGRGSQYGDYVPGSRSTPQPEPCS